MHYDLRSPLCKISSSLTIEPFCINDVPGIRSLADHINEVSRSRCSSTANPDRQLAYVRVLVQNYELVAFGPFGRVRYDSESGAQMD